MSKAFTREDDTQPELPEVIERAATLPDGVRNYLTPGGAARLRAELAALENPAGSDLTDRETARLARLHEILPTAEVLPPPPPPHDRVRFGAAVTVRDPAGEESIYRLVGTDETDLEQDWVSWRSPIARALLNARLGEKVRFRFPSGETELEVIALEYPA